MLTVSLRDVIREWEVVNKELYTATTESHDRYPFPSTPSRVKQGKGRSEEVAPRPPIPESSTESYRRVYHLLADVRYISEDARYNTFHIVQQLLWVSVVAWANQLACASQGVIQLPPKLHYSVDQIQDASGVPRRGSFSTDRETEKRNESAKGHERQTPITFSSPESTRTIFPCPLLPPLELWKPSGSADVASNVSNAAKFSTRRVSHYSSSHLPEIWDEAVRRIFAVWCSSPSAYARNATDSERSPLVLDDPPSSASTSPSNTAPHSSTIHYAYVWTIVAQHYRRFKALLSLFFLRYDALLEDMEKGKQSWGERRQRLQRDHRRHGAAVEKAAPLEAVQAAAASLHHASPQRRSGVSDSVLDSTEAAPHHPNEGDEGGTMSRRGLRPSPSATKGHSALPNTSRLLTYLMGKILRENLVNISKVTWESLLVFLMPRTHRAHLRNKSALLNTPVTMSGHFLQEWIGSNPAEPPSCSGRSAPEGDENDDTGDEDDDRVVWSAPPSPLLSYVHASSTGTINDAAAAEDKTEPTPSCTRRPPTAVAVSPLLFEEDYVIRHVFKLLRMAEDCRLRQLQRLLVEDGKRVASLYGSYLASVYFSDFRVAATATGESVSTSTGYLIGCGDAAGATAVPANTSRTLADANHVLREVLQAYVRLRTKLLFLNAGTTHFLGALTPWGRARMLETLNAFLCGLCGVVPPSTLPEVGDSGVAHLSAERHSSEPLPRRHVNSNAVAFTPTNLAVADFVRVWGVPLWLAMCDDTQRRLAVPATAGEKRETRRTVANARHGGKEEEVKREYVNSPVHPLRDFWAEEQQATVNNERTDARVGMQGTPTSLQRSLVTASGDLGRRAGASESFSARNGSINSAELTDVLSQGTRPLWPPTPPTEMTRRNGNTEFDYQTPFTDSHHAFARAPGRGLDLRRVMLHQQQRRAGIGPVQLPCASRTDSEHGVRGLEHSETGLGNGDFEESVYATDSASRDEEVVLVTAAAPNGVGGGPAAQGVLHPLESTGVDPHLHRDTAWLAVVSPYREHPARVGLEQDRATERRSSSTDHFSHAAQLHQMATLPDDGFPCLLYLVPRRSRFAAQDQAAAAVQQQLFTRFSSSVQEYLVTYLAECEARVNTAGAGEVDSGVHSKRLGKAAVTSPQPRGEARKDSNRGSTIPDIVLPLPSPVFERMMFLLEMTYAALQGSSDLGAYHRDGSVRATTSAAGRCDIGRGPVMETGLTPTGKEKMAAILEQENGEYESVATTTLASPTPPALLTIAAVRKGIQGFLAFVGKRGILTLAQTLYSLIQQGALRQPPAAQLESVDTIFNMASLLSSKDMFVSLVKGYLAPQMMMYRSPADMVVESQVVGRMAYRLGAAVAAPCLTLLRDVKLAMTDPRSEMFPSLLNDAVLRVPEADEELKAAFQRLDEGNREQNAESIGATAEGAQLIATRNAQTLAAVEPLRHGMFGLIHQVRVLCQAWWQPHVALLVPSRRLRQIWERHHLLGERMIDAVLRVEWRYEGNTGKFRGYGHSSRYVEEDRRDPSRLCENGLQKDSSCSSLQGHRQGESAGQLTNLPRSVTSLAAPARAVTAASMVRGLSSALGNAVRQTGRQAGDFGYHDSDESQDYSEAYGGLLTLRTLQQHHNAYVPFNPSHGGSHLSSIGGAGGTGGELRDTSDGARSTMTDDNASTTVPPDVQLERRRLRWPLSDGRLVFLISSRKEKEAEFHSSRAVQISGPPLTLMVCQLLDRAKKDELYTFDKLLKTLPLEAPKPLLAHLLHELVKADVVLRSVLPGTRLVTYQLRDNVGEVCQHKVYVDVRSAAQQHWVLRTLAAAETDTGGDEMEGSISEANSPLRDPAAATAFSDTSYEHRTDLPAQTGRSSREFERPASVSNRNSAHEQLSSPVLLVERIHKIKVCIVRIMKLERVLPHRELMQRVALALEDQFVVTPSQFKRSIGELIEREFVRRGEQEEYIYMS